MTNIKLEQILEDVKSTASINRGRLAVLASHFDALVREAALVERDLRKIARVGLAYEILALGQIVDAPHIPATPETIRYADSAFACWQIVFNASDETVPQDVKTELTFKNLSFATSMALRVSVIGLIAKRPADVRLFLKGYQKGPQSDDWLVRVTTNIAESFIFLTRKQGGWSDVENALAAIAELKTLQGKFEEGFVSQFDAPEKQARISLILLGYYHLAQLVHVTGEYLFSGNPTKTEANLKLDKHHEQALEVFSLAGKKGGAALFADFISLGARALIANSLWSHLEGMSGKLREYGELLMKKGRPDPLLELWPSQQEALKKNLFDTYKRAIIIEMPTSAGKTLLAKFYIAQTKSLSANATVFYLAPTRALVNQITFDLRKDFSSLNWKIEQAVPAYDLNPTESKMLAGDIDIVVTTPEKLDLLLRSNHPSTINISLIVVDEAHTLADSTRGSKLELLLASVKREKKDARFLLLSPFIPNSKNIVDWLGDDRALPPIVVNWKPNKRQVAALQISGRKSKRRLELTSLNAIDNFIDTPNAKIPFAGKDAIPEKNSKEALSLAAAKVLEGRGNTLILCRGKGTAITRANEIAATPSLAVQSDDVVDAVCDFIRAETGTEVSLTDCLKKGIAYHHAGLSQEARWLIEGLIKQGKVKWICGTTTLAQGMNFPISNVIIETLRKGDKDLTVSDFWNIAGRAGRALVDVLGLILFPATNAAQRKKYDDFLANEAGEIASQISVILTDAEQIGEQFNLANLRKWPQLTNLLQYLAHAVRIAGKDNIADEMESILRASLVYRQAQSENSEKLKGFMKLCRAYMASLTKANVGFLALADTTGFSTPSVLYLLAQTKNSPEVRDESLWQVKKLFGDDIQPLKSCIDMIAGIPEMNLSEGKNSLLNTERVAQILRDWVRGESVGTLAKKYKFADSKAEGDDLISDFSTYLYSRLLTNASWGMGALQNVCLTPEQKAQNGFIPSMVYFGVSSQEAVWLRMAGMPRIAANGAADLWRKQGRKSPENFDEIRGWVNSFTDGEWNSVVSDNKYIKPDSMKIVWRELSAIN